MGVKLGALDISKFYVGSQEVDKIYLGTNLVYQKILPPVITMSVDTTGSYPRGVATYKNNNTFPVTLIYSFAWDSTPADPWIVLTDIPAGQTFSTSGDNVGETARSFNVKAKFEYEGVYSTITSGSITVPGSEETTTTTTTTA